MEDLEKKVSECKRVYPVVEGCYNEQLACEAFKTHFEKSCNNNSNDFNLKMQKIFLNKMITCFKSLNVNDDSFYDNMFSVEVIDIAIAKLSTGKAPGHDGIMTEHLTHAHPVLYIALSRLFYFILRCGYVPNDFGNGLLIPIVKDTNKRGVQPVDNFRGITLSPIISKVFEHCIVLLYSKYFTTSERQFGFKRDTGCTQAIFCVRKVIDFFVENESTVNMCFLDVSKAFDRVNHYCLFIKLLDRNVPPFIVTVLQNWYSKSYSRVKWGESLSDSFKIMAGIRQGGVLSPILFSIYVNEMLLKLNNYGCNVKGLCFGSFMYADDLVLISSSLSELQAMIYLCCTQLESIDLFLNETKSSCMRIGKRWHIKCQPLQTNSGIIQWSSSVNYLGVTITSGSKFTISLEKPKSKFYSSFNAIYSQLGKINNPIVSLNLISSISLPSLLYGVEAMPLNKTIINALEHPWNKAFMRIFGVFDKACVRECQIVTGLGSVNEIIIARKANFLASFRHNINWYNRAIAEIFCL